MFKTYPLRNGISHSYSIASSVDYLAYTMEASILVCVAMELLYSLLYHIRFAYQIASLRVCMDLLLFLPELHVRCLGERRRPSEIDDCGSAE